MADSGACQHHECACHRSEAPRQNLEEVSFARSACAAAQLGDCRRLEALLSKNPGVLHSDGAVGKLLEVFLIMITALAVCNTKRC